MIEQQKTNDLQLNVYLERDDLGKGEIMIRQNGEVVTDASVMIGNYNFIGKEQPRANQWKSLLSYEANAQKYLFNVQPDSYFIEITKAGSITESRFVHIKRGQLQIDVDLQPLVLSHIIFKVQNLLTKQIIPHVHLTVLSRSAQSGRRDEILSQGQSNASGKFVCKLHLENQFRVAAEAQGYIAMHYDFEVNSSHVGNEQSFAVFMIPTKPLKPGQTQREIIIHVPNREFKINFALKYPQTNVVIDQNNKASVYDEISMSNEKFIGFSLDNSMGQKFEIWGASNIVAPNINAAPPTKVLKNALGTLNQKPNKEGNMFCKSVQNSANLFLRKRLDKSIAQQHKYSGKQFLYTNE